MFTSRSRRAALHASFLLSFMVTACGGGGSAAEAVDAVAASGSAGAASGSAVAASAPAAAASDASQAASAATASATAPAAGATAPASSASGPAASTTSATGFSQALSLISSAALSGLADAPPVAAPLSAAATGRTFFIDNQAGADTNDGLAAASAGAHGPWRTLARIMQSDIGPGDKLQLACGGVWQETLRLPANGASGRVITVSAPAGCGTAPAIDGSVTIAASAWSPYSGNIYRAKLPQNALQVFAPSGNFVEAHYPNRGELAADPTTMYLSLAADTGTAVVNGASVSVLAVGSDFAPPSGVTLTPGTRVRTRISQYQIQEATAAGFDGTHLTLSTALNAAPGKGWGYYLLGQLWMLRAAGEWYFDPAAMQLYVWMPDSSAPAANVSASVLPLGIDLHGRQHVIVDGINVRKVGFGVDLRDTTDVQLRNSAISDIADVGVAAGGSLQDVIESNQVSRTGSDAITGWGTAVAPVTADSSRLTVRNNMVASSAVIMQGDQVVSLPRSSLAAIFIGSNSVATGNVVVDAAYVGILAQTKNLVQSNFIYGACSTLDDCGGIYTGGDYNGSQIRGNTVVHSRGFLPGQPLGQGGTAAQGIYLDDASGDIVVDGNTVIDTDHGIQLHNGARNTLTGNRLFANRAAQLWMQENTNIRTATGDMHDNLIQGNEFTSRSPTAPAYLLSTRYADTSRFGQFDLNRFDDSGSPFVSYVSTASGGALYTIKGWRGLVGVGSTQAVDVHATAVSDRSYAAYAIAGTNMIANSSLAIDASAWSSWSAAAGGQLMRTPCAAGTCLRYVANASGGIISSPGFAVQQGQWYRLSVDIAAAQGPQTVPLVVRIGGADYATVADRNIAFLAGPNFARYSAVFQATRTVDPSAAGKLSARVDVDQVLPNTTVSIANLELVPITPSAAAQAAAIMVNAATSATSMSCPANLAQAGLCDKLFGLADDQPITWPLALGPNSSVILYGLDTTLLDSDGDGIADYQDQCGATPKGEAVNSQGCPLISH